MSLESEREFLRSLGLPDDGIAERRQGEPSVPVDEQRIRDFYDDRSHSEDALEVSYLIAHEEAWFRAANSFLIERAAKSESERRRLVTLPLLHTLIRYRKKLLLATAAVLLIAIGISVLQPSSGLYDNGQLVAYRNGSVTGLEQYGEQWSAKVGEALSTGLPAPEVLAELDDAVPAVRSGRPKTPVLVEPYGTAVRDTRPVFAWHPLEGIDDYEIVVRNVERDEQTEDELVVEGIVGQPGLRLETELHRGQVYEWKLKYEHDDITREVPRSDQQPALLRILTADELELLQATEEHVGDSHLLRFLLYAEFGLLHEANEQLDELREQNPNSNLMQMLEQRWEEFQQQ